MTTKTFLSIHDRLLAVPPHNRQVAFFFFSRIPQGRVNSMALQAPHELCGTALLVG
jgi:hypothetical protein